MILVIYLFVLRSTNKSSPLTPSQLTINEIQSTLLPYTYSYFCFVTSEFQTLRLVNFRKQLSVLEQLISTIYQYYVNPTSLKPQVEAVIKFAII